MRRVILAGLLGMGWMTPATAQCVGLKETALGWTADEQVYAEAAAYKLLHDAGQEKMPTRRGGELCLEESLPCMETILTATAIHAQAQAMVASALAGAATQRAEEAEAEKELTDNPLCHMALTDIDATVAKASDIEMLKTLVAGVAKCARARETLR